MKIIILIPIYNDWQSATKLLENINNEVRAMRDEVAPRPPIEINLGTGEEESKNCGFCTIM